VSAVHPNAQRVLEAARLFSTGDHTAMAELIADDAVWIYGGRSRFAGRWEGKDEVMRWLGDIHTQAETEVRPLSVLASDRHVIVLNEVRLGRGEHRSVTTEAFCCVMNGSGQIRKFFQANADIDAVDASLAAL
jgi:ketosteroid isomerase-like protein